MLVEVVFHWDDAKGKCYDCSAPAAYLVPDVYGPNRPLGEEHKRCSVCAASEAANGERIVRLWPEEGWE